MSEINDVLEMDIAVVLGNMSNEFETKHIKDIDTDGIRLLWKSDTDEFQVFIKGNGYASWFGTVADTFDYENDVPVSSISTSNPKIKDILTIMDI